MKTLLLNCRATVHRLRRGCLKQARGVPAEGLSSQRWRKFGKRAGFFLRLGLVSVLILPGVLSTASWSPLLQLAFFFGSIWLGIATAIKIGLSLIPADHGSVLVATPIENTTVWRLSLGWLPGRLLAAWVVVFALLLFLGEEIGEAFLTSGGWLLTVVALIGIAFLLRGRAMGGLRIAGKVWLGVGLLVLFARDWPEVQRLIVWLSQNAHYLPSNWLRGSLPGLLGATVIVAGALTQYRSWRRSYRFRPYIAMTPNLLRPVTSGTRKQPSNEASLRKVGRHWGVVPQMFWSQDEKALGRALGFHFPVVNYALPLVVIALVLLVKRFGGFVLGFQEVIPVVLLFVSSFAAIILALRGWPSATQHMAFCRLPCHGGRQVSILGAFPISERQLFRSAIKERVAGELIWIPIRLWIVFTAMNFFEVTAELQLPVPLLILVIFGRFYAAIHAWTQSLWRAVELFPDTLKGLLSASLLRYSYSIPLVVYVGALVFFGFRTSLFIGKPSLFFLSFAALSLWLFAGLIITRRNYQLGKGSLIVKPVKKSFNVAS